jgi:transposase
MNKTRSSVKCLFYDGTGLVLICKRLERGTFSRLNPYFTGEITLTAAEFSLFFEGADFSKRFLESPSERKKSFSVNERDPSMENKNRFYVEEKNLSSL